MFLPFSSAGGVKASGDLAVTAPVSGMTVNVATGEVLVPGSSSSTQGLYYGRVSSTTNLAVAASNPSNPRIDMVYAAITDAAYTGATNTFVVAVATGTPTVGATLVNLNGAPALPTSAIILAYCLVPANATNIITADLSDQRVIAKFGFSTGTPVYASTTARDAAITSPTDGLFAYTASGGTAATPRSLWRYDGGAAAWVRYQSWGTGTPVSNVTATVSCEYFQTDGGVGTVLWLKETGTGNTGWAAYGASFTPTTTYLAGNVALTTANTTYDGPATAALTSGKVYLVAANAQLNANAQSNGFTAWISDGTTVFAVGEQQSVAGAPAHIGLGPVVVTGIGAAVTMHVRSNISGDANLTRTVPQNDPGGNTATSITVHEIT